MRATQREAKIPARLYQGCSISSLDSIHFRIHEHSVSIKKRSTLLSTTILVFIDRFLQRGHIACNAECCNSYCNSVRPSDRLSVRLSHASIVPRQTKIGSCGLHCEIAKTLQFTDTNNGWGRRPRHPKIGALSDPPPLQNADFDQYLLITSPQ